MKRFVWISLFLCCSPALVHAGPAAMIRPDTQYDQYLRYEASTDSGITPAKVIHWLMGQSLTSLQAPRTEFQPTIAMEQSHVRFVAAVAYKFN